MSVDYIRYDLLVQDALRSVVRKVVSEAARSPYIGVAAARRIWR